MANYNAVIKDSEFIDTKKYVDNFFKCFSSAMEQYCVILEKESLTLEKSKELFNFSKVDMLCFVFFSN